jgi:hypothetical protein
MLGQPDWVSNRVRLGMPQRAEWQRIGKLDRRRDDLYAGGFRKRAWGYLLRGRRTKRRIKQKLNSAVTQTPHRSVPTTCENAPASLHSLRFSLDQIQLHHADVVAAVADLQICNLEHGRSVS